MSRAYNQDLRDRVIDAALGGMPARRAGGPIRVRDCHGDCVGAPGARESVSGRRQPGPAAAPQARPAARLPARSGRIDPDMTIVEMQQRLATGARHQGVGARRRKLLRIHCCEGARRCRICC